MIDKLGQLVETIGVAARQHNASPFSRVLVREGTAGPERQIQHVLVRETILGPEVVLQVSPAPEPN